MGVIGNILGLYRDNGTESGNYWDYRVYIRNYVGSIGVYIYI